jgi:hypothetical protein
VSTIVALLRGGDPRVLHGVSRVVDDVLHDPPLFGDLVAAMAHEDPVVRMRAADAAEKITRTNPAIGDAYKGALLVNASLVTQSSLRWHFAQIVPRLALCAEERREMVAVFKRYLNDDSAIVKTCAMQALADLALADPSLRRTVLPALRAATAGGTAAMRSRGTKLLAALGDRGTRS